MPIFLYDKSGTPHVVSDFFSFPESAGDTAVQPGSSFSKSQTLDYYSHCLCLGVEEEAGQS